MGSDVLKLPAQQVARLAEALAQRQSGKPLRVGIVRDAEMRDVIGPLPSFPALTLLRLTSKPMARSRISISPPDRASLRRKWKPAFETLS